MKKNDVIFLVPSLEQPRVLKRIIDSSNKFENINIYGFTRKIHRVGNFQRLDGFSNIKYTIIGSFDDISMSSRFYNYLKLLYVIYKNYGFKKKNIYVFGFDLRVISSLIINKQLSYEISDIMWLYKKGLMRRILKWIDFVMVKKSDLVIFTSEGFYKKYFNFLKKENVLIRENKFKTYDLVKPISEIKIDIIRLAYIGAFRYKEIVNHLIAIVSELKGIVILNFYGDGPSLIIDEIKEAAKVHKNINYYGPFKNPNDLEIIYGENNLNFVAYDNQLENEQVAMPNKFYESGYFNIPIVCSNNTFVGERVMDLGMGWIIIPTKEGIDDFLKSLSIKEIEKKHDNIKKIDKRLFLQ